MSTKGPWKLGDKIPFGPEGKTPIYTIFGNDSTISNGPSVVVDCVNEDDANLIAAAPDLLQTLEIIAYKHYKCSAHDHNWAFYTKELCLKAIAKAKGERQ